jgi:hypothetical protein
MAKQTVVLTKRNADLMTWWTAANIELEKLGLRPSKMGEASDAYEVGESPETFAAYAAGIADWNEQHVAMC